MSALLTPDGSVNCAAMSSAVWFHVYAGTVASGKEDDRVVSRVKQEHSMRAVWQGSRQVKQEYSMKR